MRINLSIPKNMFDKVKVLFVSIFSVGAIELTEKIGEMNVLIELLIQGLIGILTIVYLVIKIKNSIKDGNNNKANKTKK